jgi:type IV pilus assembly protein PilC
MPSYTYTALDKNGTRRSGVVDARAKDSASTLLKEQGLFVVSLEEKKGSTLENLMEFRGVPFGEVVSFTRQLSTMISAGLSISKALEVLADQTTNKKFGAILHTVLRNVEGGSSLAVSLSKYPEIFSPTYQALIRAGEASGKLDQILARLADTMEDERELRSKFKSAMIYPSIVMVAMVGVFFLLMVFVVPQLSQMYESLNIELPIVTRFMISISNFMVKNVILVILGFIGVVVGFRMFMGSENGRILKSKIAFVIPVFGKINRKKELTEFTRTLSLLLASAVPIVDALHIVSEVMQSESYKTGAMQAALRIEKGGSLSSYIKNNEAFPPILGSMIATGEETGRLDEVLERLSEFFASETEHAVEGLSAALEPIILIMLGAMVGFLIISIITPIYKITTAL